MKHSLKFALVIAAVFSVSACVEEAPQTSTTNPMFPNVGFSPDVSATAVNACRAALVAQTDGGVEVVGTEFSQANNAVYMVVGPQRAPWRCLVSNDGQIAEMMFVGSEGNL